jgi:hypothetical protein
MLNGYDALAIYTSPERRASFFNNQRAGIDAGATFDPNVGLPARRDWRPTSGNRCTSWPNTLIMPL